MKKIESPIIFDNLKNAVLGGLYDPAFGPMDPKEKCVTCGLNNFECTGHFGHIEVSVPLYNPLVFMCVSVLLAHHNHLSYHCHHLLNTGHFISF